MLRLTLLRIVLAFSVILLPSCTTPAPLGEVCVDDADCDEGLTCRDHVGADPDRVCMADCDLAVRLCATGEVCTRLRADSPLGTCYLGGATAVGASCTTQNECAAGSVCVSRDDLGMPELQQCYHACATDEPEPCAIGETCLPLTTDGTDGFCDIVVP